jgi:hypothetical protein
MTMRKADDRFDELAEIAGARRPDYYLPKVAEAMGGFDQRFEAICDRIEGFEKRMEGRFAKLEERVLSNGNGKGAKAASGAPWWWKDKTARWILILLIVILVVFGGPPLLELALKAWKGP